MKRIIDYIKRIHEVAYKNGKSTLIMTIDIGIWYIFYGATLTDYFNYEFYNKSFKERKKYAVVRTQNKFYEKVSPSKYKEYFTVKPNFLKNFKDYIGRDYYTYDMGIDKLKEFLSKNKEFMVKPIDGLGGLEKAIGLLGNIEKVYDKYYETLLKAVKSDLGKYKPKRKIIFRRIN